MERVRLRGLFEAQQIDAAVLSEVTVEAECCPDAPTFDHRKGKSIAEALVLVGELEEDLARPFFLGVADPEHG